MKAKFFSLISSGDYNLSKRGQITLLIKARTQKRALEILQSVRGRSFTANYFRNYAGQPDPKSQTLLEVTCDASEGLWWKDLDYTTDDDYKELWSAPITE